MASDVLPELESSNEIISCPAHTDCPGGELEGLGFSSDVQRSLSVKLLLFFVLGKHAVLCEADHWGIVVIKDEIKVLAV